MGEIVSVRSIEIVTAEIRMIEENAKRVLCEAVVAIGTRLCEAKELVPAGTWMEYLESELGYKPSTAQNYMRIAREFGGGQVALDGKTPLDLFGALSYTQLLPLVGLPEEERQELAEGNDLAGMSSREIRELVKERDALKKKADRLPETERAAAETAKQLKEVKVELKLARGERADAFAAQKQARQELAMAQKQLAELTEKAEQPRELTEEELKKLREEAAAEMVEAVQAAEQRAAEATAKLEKAKNPAAAQVNFLFGEIGTLCKRLGEAFDSLAGEQPEVAGKFRGAIGQFFAAQAGRYKGEAAE